MSRAPLWALLVAVLVGAGVVPTPASASVAPVRWCGADASSVDRLPDAVGGRQVHVVYAVPADGSPRIGAASRVATIAAEIEAWWRREDPGRTPRFDLFPFPGCDSTFGALDITVARLPNDAAFYFPLSRIDRIVAVRNALAASPFDLADPGKKYVVFYDGPIAPGTLCGGGQSGFPLEGGSAGYSIVFSGPGSGNCDLGGGGVLFVAAHEFLHSLDALPSPFPQPGPPHPCPGDLTHVCDHEWDLLYGLPRPYALEPSALDHGRDDYYAHGGPWWDVQDSPFLARVGAPLVPLTVVPEGVLPGERVVGNVPGIFCPPVCSTVFEQGSEVTLTATGGVDRLVVWRGACTGTDPCTLRMDGPRTVTALFRPLVYRLTLTIHGQGRVTSVPAFFSCRRSCSDVFETDSTIGLRATPRPRWRFAGWSGDCRGRGACRVRFEGDRVVGARFVRARG